MYGNLCWDYFLFNLFTIFFMNKLNWNFDIERQNWFKRNYQTHQEWDLWLECITDSQFKRNIRIEEEEEYYCSTVVWPYRQSEQYLIDQANAVNIVYLGFSKFFNKVSYNILVAQLVKCRLGDVTVRWLWSWLADHTPRMFPTGSSTFWRAGGK